MRGSEQRQDPGKWDETYIKVKGRWCYFYRAVNKHGKTLDFMLSKRQNWAAARLFFRQDIEHNGAPDRVVIDESGANPAGLQQTNTGMKFSQAHRSIEILRVKYLNNIVEHPSR